MPWVGVILTHLERKTAKPCSSRTRVLSSLGWGRVSMATNSLGYLELARCPVCHVAGVQIIQPRWPPPTVVE
jgi:hypothetical protein